MARRLDLTTDMTSAANIPPNIEVIATLLVDPQGRVSQGGTSRTLSTPLDRDRFLSFRKWGSCILIGGRTFRVESYGSARLPVEVFSRKTRVIDSWSVELDRLKREHGRRILVEAGPGLLQQLLDERLIDRLYLTRTDRRSSDQQSPVFDLERLNKSAAMKCIESVRIGEDTFEIYEDIRLT